MSYAKIRLRRGTAYEWNTENPILHEGEIVLEVPDSGVGTGLSKFKIGDGVTPYRNLPYAFDGAAASAINGGSVDAFHLIQLRAGTSEQWELSNPVLEANEIAYDSTYHSFKVGDGVKSWNDLKFINAASDMNNMMDFGDPEEYDPNYVEGDETVEESTAYSLRGNGSSTISDGTATIADLIPEPETTEEEVVEETITEEPVVEEEVIEEEETVEEVVEETTEELEETSDEEDPLA